MILNRYNIPKTGTVTWPNPLPAYPNIKPNHPYELKEVEDGQIAIFTHDGFLGFDENEYILTDGECTEAMLAQAIYTP